MTNKLTWKMLNVEANLRFRLRKYLGAKDIEGHVEACMDYVLEKEWLSDLIKALSKSVPEDHDHNDPDKDDFAAVVHDFIGDEYLKCDGCEKYILCKDHCPTFEDPYEACNADKEHGELFCSEDCERQSKIEAEYDRLNSMYSADC